jgi:hypothetical protein
VKRIPETQHTAMIDLTDFWIEHKNFAIPQKQSSDDLKPLNLLLRRGYVIRAEFNDRRFGYRPTNEGLDYILATEPEQFSPEAA